MATTPDRHQPSFSLWPLQNARTAYQPVWLPVILVVPHRRTLDGTPVANSEIFDLIFRIEDTQQRIPVTGEDNIGLFVPDFDRFQREVTSFELSARRIFVDGQRFEDKTTGESITMEEAEEGDYLIITTANGNLTDKIPWYPDADYYDLSSITIDTWDLKPPGKYVVSWCAHYYGRVVTDRDELFCVDESGLRLARLPILFQHPGDMHLDLIEKIPNWALSSNRIDEDETVKFLRPFADVLQDVYDEVGFLERINHIDHIPSAYIPYLAYLLGWHLPFFPGSTNAMRRRVLKNARRLQKLKGSKRALRELFEIFGFAIDVLNVWFSEDGKSLIGVDDPVEDPTKAIERETVSRADPLLSDYSDNGFGELDIPLLYRPTGDMTVEGWLVKTDSTLYAELVEAADSWTSLESEVVATDTDGYMISTPLHSMLSAGSAVGYSQVLVNQTVGGISENRQGRAPLSKETIRYDGYKNTLSVTFDHHIDFGTDTKLFVFVTYARDRITVPTSMQDLRSNYFDIDIIDDISGMSVDARVLEFLLEFVLNLKAFHALLRKISFTIALNSVYNVTDFCVGSEQLEEPGTTIGEAQVPPAIIPTVTTEVTCSLEGFRRSFKDEDFQYRNDVIAGLQEEFLAYKALDCTHKIPESLQPIYQSASRLTINAESLDESCNTSCEYTNYGQDSKLLDPDFDPDHDTDTRETACDIENPDGNYCYTGRVRDEFVFNRHAQLSDIARCNPCGLSMGHGVYFTYPPSAPENTGSFRYDDIANLNASTLSRRLVQALAFKKDLMLTYEETLNERAFHGLSQFYLTMPQLEIQKDNLFFPGHRFVTMDKLEADFTSEMWSLRPWDDQNAVECWGDVAPLDWTITLDTAGDEVIVFDDQPLTYLGNGLTPDVPSLGDHDVSARTDQPFVTHSIYSDEGVSHEAITLDDTIVELSTTTGSGAPACIGSDVGPIFNSANVSSGGAGTAGI